jgi:hypothetical protein
MPDEDPQAPPTEGQIVPPEEQILPTGGGTMPPPEQPVAGGDQVQTDEQTQDEPPQESEGKAEEVAGKLKEAAPEAVSAAAGGAQSLASQNRTPIALAAVFAAGVVVGRLISR